MKEKNRQEVLRTLPSVDEVLQVLRRKSTNGLPAETATDCVRDTLARYRQVILEAQDSPHAHELDVSPEGIAKEARARVQEIVTPKLRKVVNASGVILHTNLGRAPLGADILRRAVEVAAGYSNLEFDLEGGKRGRRDAAVESLIRRLTGAEAAGVVNNNAGAVLLCLSSLAAGKEVIVSRGELVEIGGGFRIPEVMRQSSAILREVGTTNKTRLTDFANAIGENTALLLKVHTSNYRIVGFTEEVTVRDLARLGREREIPVMVDLGSGCLTHLRELNTIQEETPSDILGQGADLVTFSGDKLLGGPQAGIFAGNRNAVDPAKTHPLMRALRLDKLSLSILEGTLLAYLDSESVADRIPAIAFLSATESDVRERAERLLSRLSSRAVERLRPRVVQGSSRAGGGTLPTQDIPTALIAVNPTPATNLSPDQMEARLRALDPPVIGRIQEDVLLLDLRTVFPDEEGDVLAALESLSEEPTG